jgi:ElaB/YqjD/DUF883 family membrane-anchored ribosome-binding protein
MTDTKEQREGARVREAVQRIKEELATLTKKTPPNITSWSSQTTHSFKKAHFAAQAALSDADTTLDRAQTVLTALRAFY